MRILLTTIGIWAAGWLIYTSSLSKYLPESTSAQPPKGSNKWVDDTTIINDRNDYYFHFIQITDIHISTHQPKYLANLRRFLNSTLDRIAPELVLVSGDLTDAKAKSKQTSLQYLNEWRAYWNLLDEFNIFDKKDFWFDSRGNHDCFDVPGFQSPMNYFATFSSQKTIGFNYTLEKSFGKYTFVGIDACPKYGPNRPFNFFGVVDTQHLDSIFKILDTRQNSNHTFILSHYPTSTSYFGTSNDGRSLSHILQMSSLYLCGHLHQLFLGIGKKLYGMHDSSDTLELELGDMKEHQLYRIVVVDHDLISFRDFNINESQIPVIISNPKDNVFSMPSKEPLMRIKSSTHIRFFVFNNSNIKSFAIKLDEKILDNVPVHISDKLWSVEWNPIRLVESDKHSLSISVTDEHKQKGMHSVSFVLNGKRIKTIGGFGDMFITSGLSFLLKYLSIVVYFTIMIFIIVIPRLVLDTVPSPVYLKYRHSLINSLKELDEKSLSIIKSSSFRKLFIDTKHFLGANFVRFCDLADTPRLYWPLYFFGMWMSIGPLFIGDFCPSSSEFGKRYGLFFPYGIRFLDGEWILLTDTWAQYTHEILYAYFPLTIYLSYIPTSSRELYARSSPRHHNPIHLRWYIKGVVGIVWLYNISQALLFGLFYGWSAILLSPGKIWTCIWALYIIVKVWLFNGERIKVL